MENFLEDIKSKIGTEEKSIDKIDNKFWKIEVENDLEESYIIYDCSEKNCKFDYKRYDQIMRREEGISYPIMVFKNWECERQIRNEAYKRLNNATERKKLLEWFDRKTSHYTEIKERIKIDVEGNGENYLEYTNMLENPVSDENILKGRIYNLAFSELKKIFNITGKNLFKKNVRFGINNDKVGNSIRNKFKKYIKIGIYENWKNTHGENQKIKEAFDIEEEYLRYLPENFWFYHNGVTIFYYGGESIDFCGTSIILNPKKISVINGAQTITNFFEGIKEIEENIDNICEENLSEDKLLSDQFKQFFKIYIEEILKEIKVKTIFIDGKEDFLKPITYGLNTQIPIAESDIIADSDEVNSINQILRNKSMRICKAGESNPVQTTFSVLEFVKKYLIAELRPGTSKNLQRKDLSKYIKEANREFQNDSERLLNAIEKIMIVEEWWKESKKDREKLYVKEPDRYYVKYGKNYFESYILMSDKEPLDDDSLGIAFNEFIEYFRKVQEEVSDKVFKNDELFKKYQENWKKYKKAEDTNWWDAELKEGLKIYLNNTEDSRYKIRKMIVDYLSEKDIDISYFRVIAYTDGKPRESYPFPNTTFSQLYQKKQETAYPDYEDSLFYNEIQRKFSVFVIDWREDVKAGKRVVNDILYIPNFTFSPYNKSAEEVYKSTIKAFKDGDENEFIKMGDKKDFHIRPKAVNSEDAFEFTNGRYITKRTFWANKTTVEHLISNYKANE